MAAYEVRFVVIVDGTDRENAIEEAKLLVAQDDFEAFDVQNVED